MSSKIKILLERTAAVTDFSEDKMSSIARAERTFSDESEAKIRFGELREKLFRVERWNADSGLSSFELYGESGERSLREPARTGDFIKITLAGSGKSDWVKIINIDRANDEIILTVQPSYNPIEETTDNSVTSHFFTRESTNNFCLQRTGAIINFYVIGLDEKPNTEDTNNIIEAARNLATANVGHYLGIQKGEWTTFCKNFLEIESEK